MSDQLTWNKTIIDEFRANAGKVGGRFAGRTLLLLHTVGAKSGAGSGLIRWPAWRMGSGW